MGQMKQYWYNKERSLMKYTFKERLLSLSLLGLMFCGNSVLAVTWNTANQPSDVTDANVNIYADNAQQALQIKDHVTVTASNRDVKVSVINQDATLEADDDDYDPPMPIFMTRN
jgi:hypothetical protein